MMRVMRRVLVLMAAITVIAALGGCNPLGGSGQGVAYVSEVDGNAEIYVVDPDSGPPTPAQITARPSSAETSPRWSPDGRRIAFVSSESGNLDIRVASGDGEDAVIRLTSSDGNEDSPHWNPDGDRVAYVSDVDGHSDVYVSSLDGDSGQASAPVRVTSGDTDEFLGDWSPDGQWLVFSRRAGPSSQQSSGQQTSGQQKETQGLWLRNPAGVNLVQLTEGDDLSPVWSPDGDAIAFVRNVDGNRDVYLLRPQDDDGWRGRVKAEPLAASPEADHSPAWAPDGDVLAFVSDRDGNPEIYVLDTDESGPPQRLTMNEAEDSQPVWSPDGNRIAFVSQLHGPAASSGSEIFVMDADGANQQRLTYNEASDHSPDW